MILNTGQLYYFIICLWCLRALERCIANRGLTPPSWLVGVSLASSIRLTGRLQHKQTLMYFLQIAYEGCHVSWRICVCERRPARGGGRTSVKVARAEMQNDQICVCPNADGICASSCLAVMFSGRALLFVIGS